jgi:hypothetical protein
VRRTCSWASRKSILFSVFSIRSFVHHSPPKMDLLAHFILVLLSASAASAAASTDDAAVEEASSAPALYTLNGKVRKE